MGQAQVATPPLLSQGNLRSSPSSPDNRHYLYCEGVELQNLWPLTWCRTWHYKGWGTVARLPSRCHFNLQFLSRGWKSVRPLDAFCLQLMGREEGCLPGSHLRYPNLTQLGNPTDASECSFFTGQPVGFLNRSVSPSPSQFIKRRKNHIHTLKSTQQEADYIIN